MSITTIIIGFTFIFSLIGLSSRSFMDKFIFSPYMVKRNNEYHRFLTSGFLHADLLHLMVNMLVLYFFGKNVEYGYASIFGEKGLYYFIMLYIAGVVLSELPTYKNHQDNIAYRSLGASGATSAVLFASVAMFPIEKVCLYGLICFPGFIMGAIYLFYSARMAKKKMDNINHDAHFYGAAFGFIYTILLRPTLIIDFFNQIISWVQSLI